MAIVFEQSYQDAIVRKLKKKGYTEEDARHEVRKMQGSDSPIIIKTTKPKTDGLKAD